MLADIIIQTYNQEVFTIKCFESIRKYTDTNKYRIIWVDNGSTKESREKVIQELLKHSHYLTIWLDAPVGFVKAINLGLRASKADYIVIQNNDTQVIPNWLDRLVYPFTVDSRVAMSGPFTTKGLRSWQSWDNVKKGINYPISSVKIIIKLGLFSFENPFCTVRIDRQRINRLVNTFFNMTFYFKFKIRLIF
jgi:GT2 family glycosyltransferase